jgi:hypothetical protein
MDNPKNYYYYNYSENISYHVHSTYVNKFNVTTLTLGLWPRQRLVKVQAKCEGWESNFIFPRVWESVREWTLTLPNGLSLWKLNSRWTLEFLESNCRGQKSLDWRMFYNIGKLLECKCLKWALITHLDTSNTSYGQKKGWRSN